MALESQLKRLSDIVRAECLCAACHKEFDEPKCLPCTHNFCMKCLKKATRSRSKYVECPIDRHKFLIPAGGISALPTNISLMRILEATPKRQAVAELEEALNKSRYNLLVMRECLEETKRKTLENDAEEAKKEIRDMTTDLIRVIRAKERQMLDDVDDVIRKQNRRQSVTNGLLMKAEFVVRTVEDVLLKGDYEDIMERKDHLLNNLEDVCEGDVTSSLRDKCRSSIVLSFVPNQDLLQSIKENTLGNVQLLKNTPMSPCSDKDYSESGKFFNTFLIPRNLKERFNPEAVTTSSNGLIAVLDSGNKRVLIFNEAGDLLNLFGQAGSGLGQFSWPRGIAFTNQNEIIVSDALGKNGQRLQVFSSDGDFKRSLAESCDPTVRFIGSIFCDSKNRVVSVCCHKKKGSYRVYVHDMNGKQLMWFAGSSTPREQLTNTETALYHNGEFFVSDRDPKTGNAAVKIFNDYGAYLRTICERPGSIKMAMDFQQNALLIYESSSKLVTIHKRCGGIMGEFEAISSVVDMELTRMRDSSLVVICNSHQPIANGLVQMVCLLTYKSATRNNITKQNNQ